VSGHVTDDKGDPMIGVTVLEEGTLNGTATDFDGMYTIEVSGKNAVLTFSFLGWNTLSFPVGDLTSLDVMMKENTRMMDEVVVTALGFEEREDQLGYANSTISNSTIIGAAETNLINAMSGKASGVRVSRNSGDPGGGAYIQIRGISTIDRDAQPLIVVDGVPISNDSRGPQETFAAQSRLNDINPFDIESVTVLKGASAAALWGTRALGGVIIIKTKSGKYNQKLSINVTSTYSIDQISRRYPLQTKFGQGDNGIFDQRSRDSWGDKIADRPGGLDEFDTSGQFYIDQAGNTYYPIVSKNSRDLYHDQNFDQIFQNGSVWENSVSLSGGHENSTIYVSLGDINQKGIIRNNSDYRRTTGRVNVSHRMTEKFKIQSSSTYARSTSARIRRGASSSGLHLGLLRTPPDFDGTGYRGDYYASGNSSPISDRHRSFREPLGADETATYNNPLWTINEQESLVDVERFISSLELTLSPANWLNFIGRIGLDNYVESQQDFYTPGSASGDFTRGYFGRDLARNSILNMDLIAKANKQFNSDFSGSLLVGFNFNNKRLITEGSDITNFIQFNDVASGIRDIDNALPENRNVSSTFGQERTVGMYTAASLAAFDMLFLNATLRAESASTFGTMADNTFYFPSVSLAWQFTKLLDLDNQLLSFGKLRASYGEVGVQPARYRTSNNFISPVYSDNLGGSLSGDLYGNGSFVPSNVRGSTDLRPERKKEFEIGVDLRFLEDKLSFSATYYKNRTEDVLLDFPVANSRGITQLYTNGAEMENKGVELDLGYTVIRNKDWQWDVNFIYSRVQNDITKLGEGLNINLGGLAAVSARAIEGYPIGVLSGGRFLRDENGSVVFDQNGFPEQDNTPGVIGDPNPDWQGSAFTTLSYKNFSLSLLFETYQGAQIFAGTKAVMYDLGTWEATGTETIADQNLVDSEGNVILAGTSFRGTAYNFGAGPVALTESWYNGIGGYFGGGIDELYIEDGSLTRLREMTLSYRLNSKWLKENAGVSNAQLSFTGRNLFLWTPFEGNDPDTNLQGVSVARGIDYFNNPGTKSFVFSLSVTF
jgi:TonB-linked SusC/RagA family outer membrane protein